MGLLLLVNKGKNEDYKSTHKMKFTVSPALAVMYGGLYASWPPAPTSTLYEAASAAGREARASPRVCLYMLICAWRGRDVDDGQAS